MIKPEISWVCFQEPSEQSPFKELDETHPSYKMVLEDLKTRNLKLIHSQFYYRGDGKCYVIAIGMPYE